MSFQPFLLSANPFAPKSDQHLFSPFNIKGYRNIGKDHQVKYVLTVNQMLLISIKEMYEVMFKKRAAVFYRGLKMRGIAECF